MTTIFTETMPGSDSGNNGLSLRNVFAITGGSLGQVRVTFSTPGGSPAVVDHASIGIATGTLSNTTAAPVELTFSGGHGFTFPATSTPSIVSDWVNLPGFTSSNDLVVVMDLNATTGGGDYGANVTTSTGTMYFLSGASYNVATPSGTTTQPTYGFVALIETQAGAGGGNTPYNPWPQLGPITAQKHRLVGWSPNIDPRRRLRKPARLVLPRRALLVPERKLLRA